MPTSSSNCDLAEQYANEFPVNSECFYLNHAAVAPWPVCAGQAVKKFATENVTYGASHYPEWLKLEEQLRNNLGKLLDVTPHSIALVKNTSEALSFVAYGLYWRPGDVVVISDHEFPSNRIVWESLASKGVIVKQVSLPNDDPESELIQAIQQKPRLVSISAVQYANGQVLDLKKIGEACRQHNVLYCIDAIQMIGAMPVSLTDVKADFAMADGHKWMLGSEGLGFFYVRPEIMDELSLTEYGWHMIEHAGNYQLTQWQIAKDAKRFECGSPNMLGAHALNASIELLLNIGLSNVHSSIRQRVHYLQSGLTKIGCNILTPPSAVTGTMTVDDRTSGILLFSVNDSDNEKIYRKLMQASVICAHRGGGIRLSPHFHTPIDVLDGALDIIERII